MIEDSQKIADKIQRRRLQILVHSCLYYRMNTNVIDDVTFDRWARDLDDLQKEYPEIAREVIWNDAFEDFSPSTGFNLPIDDPWVIQKATWLKGRLISSSDKSSTRVVRTVSTSESGLASKSQENKPKVRSLFQI